MTSREGTSPTGWVPLRCQATLTRKAKGSGLVGCYLPIPQRVPISREGENNTIWNYHFFSKNKTKQSASKLWYYNFYSFRNVFGGPKKFFPTPQQEKVPCLAPSSLVRPDKTATVPTPSIFCCAKKVRRNLSLVKINSVVNSLMTDRNIIWWYWTICFVFLNPESADEITGGGATPTTKAY